MDIHLINPWVRDLNLIWSNSTWSVSECSVSVTFHIKLFFEIKDLLWRTTATALKNPNNVLSVCDQPIETKWNSREKKQIITSPSSFLSLDLLHYTCIVPTVCLLEVLKGRKKGKIDAFQGAYNTNRVTLVK